MTEPGAATSTQTLLVMEPPGCVRVRVGPDVDMNRTARRFLRTADGLVLARGTDAEGDSVAAIGARLLRGLRDCRSEWGPSLRRLDAMLSLLPDPEGRRLLSLTGIPSSAVVDALRIAGVLRLSWEALTPLLRALAHSAEHPGIAVAGHYLAAADAALPGPDDADECYALALRACAVWDDMSSQGCPPSWAAGHVQAITGLRGPIVLAR